VGIDLMSLRLSRDVKLPDIFVGKQELALLKRLISCLGTKYPPAGSPLPLNQALVVPFPMRATATFCVESQCLGLICLDQYQVWKETVFGAPPIFLSEGERGTDADLIGKSFIT
jgi:hypothetical protein